MGKERRAGELKAQIWVSIMAYELYLGYRV